MINSVLYVDLFVPLKVSPLRLIIKPSCLEETSTESSQEELDDRLSDKEPRRTNDSDE